MPRFWKRIKKFERSFLIGLTVLLLASFMVLPTLKCTGPRGGEYGGTYESAPGKTVSIDNDEFVGVLNRYGRYYQMMESPSLRWLDDLRGAPGMIAEAATWCHIVVVGAAREAGYRVGEEELKDGVQQVVTTLVPHLPFRVETYDRVVRDVYQGTKADFEQTVMEVLLKDKFLTPLIEAHRAGRGRQEGFDAWKASRERVDLEYAAVPATQFETVVEPEERTREAISSQMAVLERILGAAPRVKGTLDAVERRRVQLGRWPKDETELIAVPETPAGEPKRERVLDKMTEDGWGHPLSYRLVDDKPVVKSLGPDGKLDTPDDVDITVKSLIEGLATLRIVADAIVTWKSASGAWPSRLEDMLEAPPGRWAEPASPAGGSSAPGAPAGDVDPKVTEVKAVLKRVSGALDAWRRVTGAWPETLAALTTPPPAPAGQPSATAPLDALPKDPWGRDLVYERMGPSLVSLGADGVRSTPDDWRTSLALTVPPLSSVLQDPWGKALAYAVSDSAGPSLVGSGPDAQPGTADDLRAEIAESGARVPAPAALDPWILKDAKDGWGRPLTVQFRSANPQRFEAASAGADGVAGTDDDVKEGNAEAFASFYRAHSRDYRLPLRREFEALWVQLPLVPDESTKAAWAKLEKFRPPDIEKAAWDRFRRNAGADAQYYRTEEETTVDGKTVKTPIDPADPKKGHGAALVKEGQKGWLVPDPSVFGDLKDPVKEVASREDPLWTTYVEKGWRRVLLREMFFENLLADLLTRCGESQKKHKEWQDKGQPPPAPEVTTFEKELAALAEFQPSEADRQAGARFVEYFRTAPDTPITRTEWEKTPEFGEENLSRWLQMLAKEGDYSSLPVVVKGSAARVLLRNLKLHPEREPALDEGDTRVKVWPKFLASRAMDRAVRELETVKAAAQAPGASFQAVLEAAAKDRRFTAFFDRTGLFVGNTFGRSKTVPETAPPAEKDAIRRRNHVRRAGYDTLKDTGSRQDTTKAAIGAFGRKVLRDEPRTLDDTDVTNSAYLVRVAAREDPSPDEFTGSHYLQWLEKAAYGDRGENAPSTALKDRTGFMPQAIAGFFDDFERVSRTFNLKPKRSLIDQVYPNRRRAPL